MKLGTFAFAAGTLALGLASWTTPSYAQGPMWDKVEVNLPYTVTIGNRTLQPGEYVIRQNEDPSGGSRVLLIYSDNGMKFETSAMTIPTLDNNTPDNTKVVLHHFGNDYYFDKIWIQGKNYGYEFPLPNSVKERMKEEMQPVSVAAQYQSVPAESTATTTTTTTTTAQNTQPAAPPATTTQETTAPAATAPATTAQQTVPPATTQSQTTQSQTTMAPATETNTANREMPHTSAGWLMMLLGGGTLSGLGMVLRRKS
jgi:Zn-dependent M28 family amino/carboxypeptidase